jgi:hypothetical protein
MTDSHDERRRFKRIAFDAKTELTQGERRWQVQMVDLSLKGMLIERPEPWQADTHELFTADIKLSSDAHVQMDVRLSHDDHGQLGFKCEHISLESIEHLRRFVELNLADHDELERELAALIEV